MTRATDRIAHRYASDLSCLPPGVPSPSHLTIAFEALRGHGYADLGTRLRVLRQLVFQRLYVLDCEQAAPLGVVMQGMTDLAEFCISEAVRSTHAELVAQYGSPVDKTGKPSQMWVVGMGKLGARELNVSSDIDLIFVFDSDGETRHGRKVLANHAFYALQVQMIQRLLGAVQEHGFVFRVDLALRPFGREGALAISLKSLTQYFQRTAREWERFAWLKSRVLTPESVLPLRAVVRSFVFRRFLDYQVFVSLRELHQLIRQNVSSAHQATDVKLGRGGIREIEFAAQVLQIVRGGRQPELLARPTLTALDRLQTAQLMDAELVANLSKAYEFLRKTEHRIQYLDDAQTHVLPADRHDQDWLARSMGFADWPLFETALLVHREAVAQIFEHWLAQGMAQMDSARLPSVTLAQLQSKAPWTVQYVRKHPDVVDELHHPDVLRLRFDAPLFRQKVTLQYEALQATGLCDEESLLDLLRRAHHIEVFRILVRDVQGLLSVRDVADELSSLADSVLNLALPWCWQHILKRHAVGVSLDSHFCVIAYGKLGGKELGYGSDLDLVFLYDDDDPDAQQHYIALVRKLISWLTVKTSEGDLYEIDTALRPNGNSGLLVTSMASYEKYQLQRGSNTAWTWELQAMTRARAVFGDYSLAERFEGIRAQVLRTPRDEQHLRSEIVAMRTKLRLAYPVPSGQFDIKHSAGGMIDVEFVVQFWVLTYAAQYPALLGNVGNIELIKIATAQGLVSVDVGLPAADAYQTLRDQQHAARLQEVKAQVPLDSMTSERDAVLALWTAVFT